MARPESSLSVIGMAAVAIALAACRPSSSSSPVPSAGTSPSAAPSIEASVEPSIGPTGWRLIESSAAGAAPAAREDHTWTADGDGNIAYLFGGRATGTGALADLWAYDFADGTWQQLTGGPPPRFGHNAAWVPGVGLVIFAGQAGSTFYNDLWAYDSADDSWTQLPAGGAPPVPRYGSCAALGPDGRLWISHGFTSEGARFADTRAYDFATETWTDETPVNDAPVERCLHGCWWSGDTFNLYAGQTTGAIALGDWWALTVGPRPGTNSWAQVMIGGSGLPARNLYGVTDFRGGHLVFGGQAVDGSYLGDAWLIDHEGAPAAGPDTTPAPTGRAGAELVTDETADRVLLFGGRDGNGTFAELWELTVP
jgi:galactose oxidase-like protein